MRYQVIILLFCGIRNSSQVSLSDNICYDIARLQRYVCCYNFEMVNGMCTECKNGTTTIPGGRCVSCKNNTYGHKCIKKCECNQFRRCDPQVGCILEISVSTIFTTHAGTSEPVLILNETVATTETYVYRSETRIAEWIVLTLCIISCFVTIGFGYMIRIYRKRQTFKSRIINEDGIVEPSEPSPYSGVYDEVDENVLTFAMTDLNVTSQDSHYEAIDVVSQERLSIKTSTDHDDKGYLDPYFALEENESRKLQDRTSQKACSSSDSSNSDVVDQDNTAYNNLYQPFQENWQTKTHGYDVPVIVHNCIEYSASFDEQATNSSYYNVYKPLQKNCDMKSPRYENQKFKVTKEVNDENLLEDDCSSVTTTGNSNDYINIFAESNISINEQ